MQKIVKYWLPVVLWAVVIFLFSSHPTGTASHIDWQDFIIKKLAHIIEYAILSTLVYRGFRNSGVERDSAGVLAILIAVLYGATDEFHQSFTPGREPRIRDVGFDTIGATLAIYLIWKSLPKAPKKLKSWAKKLQII